jgi:hypothetical protein
MKGRRTAEAEGVRLPSPPLRSVGASKPFLQGNGMILFPFDPRNGQQAVHAISVLGGLNADGRPTGRIPSQKASFRLPGG